MIAMRTKLKNLKVLACSWEKVSEKAKSEICELLSSEDYKYSKVRNKEEKTERYLKEFEKKYPNVLKNDNLSEILDGMKKKSKGMSL
jgi:hypothetical protein